MGSNALRHTGDVRVRQGLGVQLPLAGKAVGATCAALLFLLVAQGVSAGPGLFSAPSERGTSLYHDRRPTRASQVGDILTVLVVETTSASNRSNVATKKSNSTEIGSEKGTGPLRFIPKLGLTSEASTDYSGEGSTERQQQIQARVSVTVVGLRPNGDLMVEGSRTITINGEQEVIYLSGAVNPLIIPANNTIESYRISDLQVSYKGKGAITQGSRPGLLVRLVSWLF